MLVAFFTFRGWGHFFFSGASVGGLDLPNMFVEMGPTRFQLILIIH